MKVPCPERHSELKKGCLWLGGDDYLVCPNCEGTELVEVIEERFTPKEQLVSMAGVGSFVKRQFHPSVERFY